VIKFITYNTLYTSHVNGMISDGQNSVAGTVPICKIFNKDLSDEK
jgi:hypothetical protein